MSLKPLRVGLVQMSSSVEREDNLHQVDRLLAQAQGCDVVVFPEYVLALAGDDSVRRAARTESETHAELGPLARKYACTVIFGGLPVWHGHGSRRSLRNAALVYSADGQPLARYDKMHLFQMNHGTYDETRLFEHGDSPLCFSLVGWQTGFSICYDLRFPELYRNMGNLDLILCPAAFTLHSGEAHWEILLRARAIENQCYVLAPAQCGSNSEVRVPKYGHSLVIDPWGKVLLDAGPEATGLFKITLEPAILHAVREKLPAVANRRIV